MTKKITIELTEDEARMVRWAVTKAVMTTPARQRGKLLYNALNRAHKAIQEATELLEDIPLARVNTANPVPKKRY